MFVFVVSSLMVLGLWVCCVLGNCQLFRLVCLFPFVMPFVVHVFFVCSVLCYLLL